MSDDERKKARTDLVELDALFGPPAVLSSENAEHYREMRSQMTDCLLPSDFLELRLVREVVDATWEMQRYVRHRTLSVERRFHQSQEFQEKRAEDRKKRREQEVQRLAQKLGVPPDDFYQLCQLNSELEGILVDTREIFDRIPTELEHARALETAIGYHEQLERLINGALARRNSALELLDQLRSGLSQRLRKESDQIIDAAYKVVDEPVQQIEAPSITPNDAGGAS
jgi:hypothetical protein